MKFLLDNYRIVSIWMSLVILAMAFVAASDDVWSLPCVAAAFLAGGCMYSLGGVREWALGRKVRSMTEVLLAVCMWIALALILLRFAS